MTPKEAIEQLESLILNSQSFHEEEGDIWEKDIEALNMAISALEKQIPKKPNVWGDGYADGNLVYDMYNCPNCEKIYEIDYEEYDCCPNCGQAIDWGDKE